MGRRPRRWNSVPRHRIDRPAPRVTTSWSCRCARRRGAHPHAAEQGAIASQHDSVQVAPLRRVEVEGRLVQRASVVPDQHVAGPPAVTVLEPGLIAVRVEAVEQRVAFVAVHALDLVAAHGVEVERGPAALRVPAHQGLPAPGAAPLLLLGARQEPSRRAAREVRVEDPPAADHRLGGVVEGVVGEEEVGELGIAARRRHVDRVEDGRLRRRFEIGVIGVPGPAPPQGLVAAPAPVGGVVGELLDHVEARKAPGRGHRRHRPAEVVGGANERLRPVEGLPAKAQHHVVDEEVVDPRSGDGVERPGQVEGRHLGAETRIKPVDVHGTNLS